MSYTDEQAQEIIRSEVCLPACEEGMRWCSNHDGMWPTGATHCHNRSAAVDVAADLLAEVKRLRDELARSVPVYALLSDEPLDILACELAAQVQRSMQGGEDE